MGERRGKEGGREDLDAVEDGGVAESSELRLGPLQRGGEGRREHGDEGAEGRRFSSCLLSKQPQRKLHIPVATLPKLAARERTATN